VAVVSRLQLKLTTTNDNYTAKDNHFERLLDGSMGIAEVRGRYGCILVLEPPKYIHIPSLPQEFLKDPAPTYVSIKAIGYLFILVLS